MFEGLPDKKLEELITEASGKMIFSKNGKLAYGAAIQYSMLRSEQERREAERLRTEKDNVFLFELPTY